MTRGPRSAAHRWALRAASTMLAVVLFAGCAGVLGVDDTSDVSVAFCDLLGRCYAGRAEEACVDRVGTALDGTDAAQRTAWLRAFADSACLETCTSARSCLDSVPVCADASCELREDCCGFITGRTDCDVEAGSCCRRKGNACRDDGDCCPGAGGCSEVTGTCGGVTCRPPGEPCLNDFQCCTDRCNDDGVCEDTICAPDGFDCKDNNDCCNGSCPPETHLCGISGCGNVGVACGDLDLPCCDGLTCFNGVCSTDECYPENADCVTDGQCCSGYCDPGYFQCGLACAADGEACLVDPQCCGGSCVDGLCQTACSTGTCVEDGECCSGACLGGLCKTECAPAGCDHTTCTLGEPLDAMCDPCVSQVCALDDYCCCTEWDSLCVKEAVNLCEGCASIE